MPFDLFHPVCKQSTHSEAMPKSGGDIHFTRATTGSKKYLGNKRRQTRHGPASHFPVRRHDIGHCLATARNGHYLVHMWLWVLGHTLATNSSNSRLPVCYRPTFMISATTRPMSSDAWQILAPVGSHNGRYELVPQVSTLYPFSGPARES
jgi:hypothetical protein